MKRLVLAGLVLCTIGFAPAPFPRTERRDANKSDLELLQGEWVVVRMIENDQPDPDATSFRLSLKRTSISIGTKKQEMLEGTFTLDLTRRPRTIHIQLGGKSKESALFLYSVDRNRLLLCGDGSSQTVPPEIAPGIGRSYIECKRASR